MAFIFRRITASGLNAPLPVRQGAEARSLPASQDLGIAAFQPSIGRSPRRAKSRIARLGDIGRANLLPPAAGCWLILWRKLSPRVLSCLTVHRERPGGGL
jgi:hypothetical protein